MIHRIKYRSKPGIPPGIAAIKKPIRNQMGLIPKNSPNPPHIPRKIRLSLERRRDFLVDSDIIILLNNIYAGEPIKLHISGDFYGDQGAVPGRVDGADQAVLIRHLAVELAHQL